MNKIVEILKTKYLDSVPTTKDLIHKYNLISPHKINEWYENNKDYIKLNLKYGDNHLFISPSFEEKIADIHIDISNKIYKAYVETTEKEDMLSNIITSEVFNSLWIEGVKSSKKRIKQFAKVNSWKIDGDIKSDIYVRNYIQAINFITSTNTVNEQNLYVLYSILTKDIDMGENQLDGFPYRQDDVEINNRDGIAPSLIKSSLDTMFDLIKSYTISRKSPTAPKDDRPTFLGVFLTHYFFELVHPYYDMNGRTGRLLMLWLSNKWELGGHMSYASEGINLFKNDFYYPAFKKSEINEFMFDATYFVCAMHCSLIAQKTIYLMIEEYKKLAYSANKVLNSFEKDVLKNLLSKDDNFYQTRDFILGYDDLNPGQVSTSLSKLVSLGFLEEVESKPKLYKVVLFDSHKKILKELEKMLIS